MTSFAAQPHLRALIESLRASADDAGLDAYVVGGTVRDALLGRRTGDLDLAVDRDAISWARTIAAQVGGHFVLLDDARGSARVVLDDNELSHIDVAELRGSIAEDLRHRDFTVDALAVSLGADALIDVTGGLADLDAWLVRMTGTQIFGDDPLRLLRAVRIASELGFEIEADTAAEVRRHAARVNEAAAERRRDELARIFELDEVYPALGLLDDLALLDALLPELTVGRGITQPEQHHAYDVFEHNLRAVEAMDIMLAPSEPTTVTAWIWRSTWKTFGWCEAEIRTYLDEEMSEGRSRRALLKMAALLHDIAKPQTRSEDHAGRVRFFGHADAGAEVARKIMRRLRFSSREAAFVSLLVAEHLRPVQLAQVGAAPTRRALYRFFRDLGDAAPAVLLLALADAAAARGPKMTSDGWSRHVGYMNSLLVRSKEEEGIVDPPRLLTGRDIMTELGVSEGPVIGRLLEALREAQAAGEVADVDGALEFVERLARAGRKGAGRTMNAAEIGFIAILAIVVAFYLIVLRPQQQEQSRQQKDIKDLQIGDEVLTTSGFLGTVKDVHIPESGPVQIVIDFGNGVVMSALSTAIAQRVAAGQTIYSRTLANSEEKGS